MRTKNAKLAIKKIILSVSTKDLPIFSTGKLSLGLLLYEDTVYPSTFLVPREIYNMKLNEVHPLLTTHSSLLTYLPYPILNHRS